MRRLSLCFVSLLLCSHLMACSGFESPFKTGDSDSVATPAPTKNTNTPQKVFVLLPLEGKYGDSGQAIRNGFMAAFYANKGEKDVQPIIKVLDTSKENINVVYEHAVAEGADVIVGPLDKDQLQTLIKSTRLIVPTLALNSVTDQNVPNLYQFGLSQLDEAAQVALHAYSEGHRRALVIAPAGTWGAGIVASFKKSWQTNGGVIVDQVNYQNSRQLSEQIRQVLHAEKSKSSAAKAKVAAKDPTQPITHRRQDIDMIFLVAEPERGREIVPLLNFYYAGNLPLYATSLIYSGHRNPERDGDLNGIQFADMPWVLGGLSQNQVALQQNVAELWKTSYAHQSKLYALGVDAYGLSRNLTQFPADGFSGVTGTLHLGKDHHIYRKLPWAKIRGGSASLLQ
jgi:outer membrane PBP1 activator LpoA protein